MAGSTVRGRAGPERAITGHAFAELHVDRIACDGYGLCAELLPELIELDDWGYPILRNATVPDELRGMARRAVEACPVLALRVRSRAGG
jgi:ferredoxin